jgi:hypothetical protein
VPPELEELLRAQIAQKAQPRGDETDSSAAGEGDRWAASEAAGSVSEMGSASGLDTTPNVAEAEQPAGSTARRGTSTRGAAGRGRTTEAASAKDVDAPKRRTTRRSPASSSDEKPVGRTTRAKAATRKRTSPGSRSTDPDASRAELVDTDPDVTAADSSATAADSDGETEA